MEKMDYLSGMRSIAGQYRIDSFIVSPKTLTNRMADLGMAEMDVQTMRRVMESDFARQLLQKVKGMEGVERDYRDQMVILQEKVHLSEASAHRVLEGLWIMRGKDPGRFRKKPLEAAKNNGVGGLAGKNGAGNNPRAGSAEKRSGQNGKRSNAVRYLAILLVCVAGAYFFLTGGDSMEDYRDVMLGFSSFISADTGATATIHETYKCFAYDPRYGYAQAFTVADVDNDRKNEVVIELSEDGYRLVLDKQGSRMYGYLFSFRGMKTVYTDGTFESSSGADDSGYMYAHFAGRNSSTTLESRGYANKAEMRFYPFNFDNIERYVN